MLDIIEDVGMSDAKASVYPLSKGLKLDNKTGDLLPGTEQYGRLIGILLYLRIGLTSPMLFSN